MDKQELYQCSQEPFRPLEFHPFDGPASLPVDDPESPGNTRSVLVSTDGGYAVAYYSRKFGAWILDDSGAGYDMLLFINNVRYWAYLPE